MSNVTSVGRQIARLFEEKLHVEIPSAETDLFETGAVDSMAFVELLLQLEEEFGIKVSFDDLELENFRSIRKIAEFIATHDGAPKVAQER
jgi:acyl carrier protein